MRYGSVCSGIEAATAAWHHMGWEPAFFSEIEAFPRAVLEHHYPDVPLHGDFTTIEENQYGKIDLLVGGTPCQSFSVAGLRGGLDDDRGNLALEFCRLAQRERPRWIVWENVPGVLSSNGGRDFGSILGALEELGYGLAYRVLDAQYFGVAQRRRRVFVVGYLGDWRRAAAVLFERQSMCGHPAPSREARKEIAPTPAARTRGGGGLGTDFDCDEGLIAGTEWPASVARTHTLRGEGFDASEDGKGWSDDGASYTVDTHATQGVAFAQNTRDEVRILGFDAYNNDVTGDVSKTIDTGQDYHHAPNVFAFSAKDHGGDATEELSPTLRAGGHSGSHANAGVMPAVAIGFNEDGTTRTLTARYDGSPRADRYVGGGSNRQAIAMAWGVRRLTPTECERLQGFPDNFTAIPWRKKDAGNCPDGPRYKALGNSMAVPVMRWIGERIQLVDDLTSLL